MSEQKLTGYSSIDKPWLKYYSEEAISAELPKCSIYEYLWENNKGRLDETALIYYDKSWSFGELFENVEKTAQSFTALGVKQGDVVTLLMPHTPESVFCLYALSKIGAISNYINVLSTTKEIDAALNECNSRLIVSLDMFCDKIPERNDLEVISLGLFESLSVFKKFIYRLNVKSPKRSVKRWSDFQSMSEQYVPTVYGNKHIAIIGHTLTFAG